jgi:hypothetical protein
VRDCVGQLTDAVQKGEKMKNTVNSGGGVNTSPKLPKVKAVVPDGPQVGAGVCSGHPALQDGAKPSIPITNPPTPTEQPASTRVDAFSTAPSATATDEPKKRAKAAADVTSSTPENHTPRDSGTCQLPQAKTVSPEQLEANRKKSKRCPGPTSEAGKRRSSQNSYKEGLYTKRLYPSLKQWEEDGEDYRAISIAVHEHYKPVGPWEGFWAEKIATGAIRNARAIGFQQRILDSDYRFGGASLSTAERHVTATSKQLAQAIQMLESIQEKRLANYVQPQVTDSQSELVSDASKSAAPYPTESSETVAGSADETEQPADSGDPQAAVDAGRSEDGQNSYGFLYDGPSPNRTLVSPSQSGQGGAGSVGHFAGTGRTNSVASLQCDSRAGHSGEAASVPSHVVVDASNEVIGAGKNEGTNPPSAQPQLGHGSVSQPETVPQQPQADVKDRSSVREPKSESVPSVARVKNVGTNSMAPGKEPAQSEFKEDSK